MRKIEKDFKEHFEKRLMINKMEIREKNILFYVINHNFYSEKDVMDFLLEDNDKEAFYLEAIEKGFEYVKDSKLYTDEEKAYRKHKYNDICEDIIYKAVFVYNKEEK